MKTTHNKSGDESNVRNYRPIRTQSSIPKIFENTVCDMLSPTFKRIIIPHQRGFMKGRTVNTNLFCYVTDLFNALDNGSQTDSVYFELAKVFGKLNYALLLCKIKGYGIGGKMLE